MPIVAAKAERALQAELRPIVCIGETLQQREAGQTHAVLRSQLAAVLDRVGVEGLSRGALAYEPVWAIGTGRTATPEQAQEVHTALRVQIGDRRQNAYGFLYGGSVKPGKRSRTIRPSLTLTAGLLAGPRWSQADFVAICIGRAQVTSDNLRRVSKWLG